MYVIIECTSLIIHLENSTTLIFMKSKSKRCKGEKIVSIDVINIPLSIYAIQKVKEKVGLVGLNHTLNHNR